MDGASVACAGGRGGNFRQRHHHVSALRDRGGFDDFELARISWRVGASAAETIRLLGVFRLFNSVTERAGVAVENHRLLAITGIAWASSPRQSAARVGYRGDASRYFLI